jgi:hypothetical protein
MPPPLALLPRAQKAFEQLAADLGRVFGSRFVALVAYGPRTGAAFARDVTAADFEALAVLVHTWHKEGLATPLVLTPEEFARSLDAFPLEYQAILDHHVVIAGTSPFDGVQVSAGDLRRACELQAKAHLIHLRQGWLEAEGHAPRLGDLVERSSVPFRILLTNIARFSGAPADTTDDLVGFAEGTVGMPADLVRAVLAASAAVGRKPPPVPGGFSAYVDAATRLWTYIDTWRPALT